MFLWSIVGVEKTVQYFNKYLSTLLTLDVDFSVVDILSEMEEAECAPSKVSKMGMLLYLRYDDWKW